VILIYSIVFTNADGTIVNGELETDAALSAITAWTLTPNAAGNGFTAAPVIAPVVATPTFSPAAGLVPAGQLVALASITPGASILYTLDGSTPANSVSGTTKLYTTPIAVTVGETIKAIAIFAGYTPSAVASAVYTVTVTQVAAPVFSPAAPGPYGIPLKVTIASPTPGAAIYYRMDGGIPTYPITGNTMLYNPAIGVVLDALTWGGFNMNALAIAPGLTNSAVVNANYKLVAPTPSTQAATPTLTPAPGSYSAAQIVVAESPTPGSTINYTTDGTEPTT
jgi:hypothetical protein